MGDSPFLMQPVGQVRGGRSESRDDDWGQSRARIELDPARFGPEALAGLDEFSHVEIIFLFDRVPDDRVEYAARRPRGRQDWPMVGIFAQRGKNRPNRQERVGRKCEAVSPAKRALNS